VAEPQPRAPASDRCTRGRRICHQHASARERGGEIPLETAPQKIQLDLVARRRPVGERVPSVLKRRQLALPCCR
jgi:hypothetical protein